MYQPESTAKDIVTQIARKELVLPAMALPTEGISGEPDDACRLFDSIMQGHPVGAFLFWQVTPEGSNDYNFYGFSDRYERRNTSYNPLLKDMQGRPLTAVLDGQQRLTALNIGLRGVMEPASRPLCLNLLWQPHDGMNPDMQYQFDFRVFYDDEGGGRYIPGGDDGEEDALWFPVPEIVTMEDGPPLLAWVQKYLPQHSHEQILGAYQKLHRLHHVIHNEKVISAHIEKSQDLEKVLRLFIRTNDDDLSESERLMSVTLARWTSIDAYGEIRDLAAELAETVDGSYFFEEDVLRAALMLGDLDLEERNFGKLDLAGLGEKWDGIKAALRLAVRLTYSFGMSGQTEHPCGSGWLVDQDAIFPIAYYLYSKGYDERYLESDRFAEDRRIIREWLFQGLLMPRIWHGGQVTGLLAKIRPVIKENKGVNFPAAEVNRAMDAAGKPPFIEDKDVEQLLDMEHDDASTFALLSLLFPFIDLQNKFHIDHVFPRACLTRSALRAAGVAEEQIRNFRKTKRNFLANLQLVSGPKNKQKRTSMPAEWLQREYPDAAERQTYIDRHLLGDVPADIRHFGDFYDARRARLEGEIKRVLGRA